MIKWIIPGKQCKSINVICYIQRMIDRSYIFISIDSENAFTKFNILSKEKLSANRV